MSICLSEHLGSLAFEELVSDTLTTKIPTKQLTKSPTKQVTKIQTKCLTKFQLNNSPNPKLNTTKSTTKAMHTYSFEKLEVWQLSKVLVKTIYIITKDFPADERFGLTNQMRRASVSVSSNVAEGSSRITANDKARFTVIAYSSIIELLNQVIISFELCFINEKIYEKVRLQITELTNKLNALHKAQLSQPTPQMLNSQPTKQ